MEDEEVKISPEGDASAEPGVEENAPAPGAIAPLLAEVIEAVLFTSQKPVNAKEMRTICRGAAQAAKDDPRAAALAKIKDTQVEEAIALLKNTYAEGGRCFELRETAAGWQLVTRVEYAPWLRQLFPENRQARLSVPAVETLAIIAYRQPITRADIEAVRGVAVDGVMQTLTDRGLIKIAGRAEVPGRPLLYETTQFFMEHFGLKTLDELPNAAELRAARLPTAEPPADGVPEAEAQSGEAPADEGAEPMDPAEVPPPEEPVAEQQEPKAETEDLVENTSPPEEKMEP